MTYPRNFWKILTEMTKPRF